MAVLNYDVRDELNALPTHSFEAWSQFWRFEEPSAPRPLHRDLIVPFTPPSASRLSELIDSARMHNVMPFTPGYFQRTEQLIIRDLGLDRVDEETAVRKWLYRRGIAFQLPVYLSWDRNVACRTTWKMVIKYWPEFFNPSSDDVTVFDGTLRWALLYYHEEELHFGCNIPRRRSAT